MNFQFTWKHEDGSIIEFSEHGWKSDDAEKATWLTEMSDLCSSSPTVPPGIHVWLQRYGRLIACEVPEGMISTDRGRPGMMFGRRRGCALIVLICLSLAWPVALRNDSELAGFVIKTGGESVVGVLAVAAKHQLASQ